MQGRLAGEKVVGKNKWDRVLTALATRAIVDLLLPQTVRSERTRRMVQEVRREASMSPTVGSTALRGSHTESKSQASTTGSFASPDHRNPEPSRETPRLDASEHPTQNLPSHHLKLSRLRPHRLP